MESTKILIIDDEPDSIKLTKYMLRENGGDFEIQSSPGGEDAILKIKKFNPHLIILDIQMPIYTGFDILAQIDNRTFEVIFLTAYDAHAIQAIKNAAIDYLLKPLKQNDLNTAIQNYYSTRHKFANQKLISLFDELMGHTPQNTQKIAFPDLDGIIFLKLDDIMYFEAYDIMSYTYLNKGCKKIINLSLKKIADKLNDPRFFRIHKSYIINVDQISKIKKSEGTTVVMNNGQELPVSRLKKGEFLAYIGEHY